MATLANIIYLAAMIDGEGCIAFARRTDYQPKYRLEVRYDVKIAMTSEETIDHLVDVLSDIAGEDLVKKVEVPRGKSERMQWRVQVASKLGVYRVLTSCLPYMVTKKLEARLCLDYLSRAIKHVRYRATDYDRRLAELAKALRHGSGEARVEALSLQLFDQVTPNQAVQGSLFDEDLCVVCRRPLTKEGRTEGLETTTVSPNDNPSHERPAPSPATPAGEDIVRYSEETPSEGSNGPRRVN